MYFDSIHHLPYQLDIIFKIFGLCYYKIWPKNAYDKYERSIISIIYAAFIQIGSVGFNIWLYKNHVGSTWTATRMYLLLAASNAVVMSVVIIFNVSREKELIRSIFYLGYLQIRQLNNGKTEGNSKLNLILLGYTASFLLIVLMLHWMTYLMRFNKELTPSEFVITLMPVLVKNVHVCQFTTYTFLLYLEFKELNKVLIQMQHSIIGLKDYSVTKRRLISIRRQHELLCRSARLLNKAFSVQVLTVIAFDFVLFVVNVYICYSKFVDERFKGTYSFRETTMLSFFSIQILLHMILIATTCFYTQKQAHQPLNLCFKVKDAYDAQLSSEINIFVLQIQHWNIQFTAMGLFKIDMTLLYSIVRSATMFLLIVIQLNGNTI